MSTPSMVTSEPGTISAAAARNAAEDGSPGTTTSRPVELGSPVTVMTPRARRARHATSAPKWRSMRSV